MASSLTILCIWIIKYIPYCVVQELYIDMDQNPSSLRKPAVAGMFYPSEAKEMHRLVQHYLNQADQHRPVPKAMIAPHAGYIYSGAIAASAYARLQPARDRIRRVVLIGPAHRVAFRGLAVPSTDAFATPLG